MVQKIHPRGVNGVPNSGPYVKRFQIRVLLSEGSILEPSLVNPIPTGEGRLSPPITTGTPNVFHLPAPL